MAGDMAVLEVNAVFGSIEIRVPITWNVNIEAGSRFRIMRKPFAGAAT